MTFPPISSQMVIGAISTLTPLLLLYARPNIKYRLKVHTEKDSTTYRLLIRSLEHADILKMLRVRLHIVGEVRKVQVFGGPWVTRAPYRDSKDKSIIFVEIAEFPAGETVAVVIETEKAATLRIDAYGSPIKPRDFAEIPDYDPRSRIKYLLPRFLPGYIVGIIWCFIFMFSTGNPALDTFSKLLGIAYRDWLLLGLFTAVAICIFTYIAPSVEHETVSGYDGWDCEGLTWTPDRTHNL